MRFTVKRSVLTPIVTQALKTCNIKEKDSIDSDFLITIKNGNVTLYAISLMTEQYINVPVEDLDVTNEAAFSLSAQEFSNVIKQFPEEEIVCVYNEEKALFSVGANGRKTQFVFPTGDADLFAPFNIRNTNTPFDCDANALSLALKHTAFCTSLDVTDKTYSAVRLRMTQDMLTAESADNYRVSVYRIALHDAAAQSVQYLLSRETSEVLANLLEKQTNVSITTSTNHLIFEWEGTKLISLLIDDGGVPLTDFANFAWETPAATITVSKANLLKSLKMASTFAKDACVVLSTDSNVLSVLTNELDRGASRDEISVQSGSGASESSISCKFLIKAIEVTTSPWIALEFRPLSKLDTNYPLLAIVDGNFEHIILPGDSKDKNTTNDEAED